MISKDTATDIALAHREVATAEALLADIEKALDRREVPDIRDAFGRRQDGLQLGVPSGNNSQRLFNVPYAMARPIIRAHIAKQRALIDTLSQAALIEAASGMEARQGGNEVPSRSDDSPAPQGDAQHSPEQSS